MFLSLTPAEVIQSTDRAPYGLRVIAAFLSLLTFLPKPHPSVPSLQETSG